MEDLYLCFLVQIFSLESYQSEEFVITLLHTSNANVLQLQNNLMFIDHKLYLNCYYCHTESIFGNRAAVRRGCTEVNDPRSAWAVRTFVITSISSENQQLCPIWLAPLHHDQRLTFRTVLQLRASESWVWGSKLL